MSYPKCFTKIQLKLLKSGPVKSHQVSNQRLGPDMKPPRVPNGFKDLQPVKPYQTSKPRQSSDLKLPTLSNSFCLKSIHSKSTTKFLADYKFAVPTFTSFLQRVVTRPGGVDDQNTEEVGCKQFGFQGDTDLSVF